jgi:hypothetical protein
MMTSLSLSGEIRTHAMHRFKAVDQLRCSRNGLARATAQTAGMRDVKENERMRGKTMPAKKTPALQDFRPRLTDRCPNTEPGWPTLHGTD